MVEKHTFVTVACSNDFGFMCLQARTMARFVPSDLIDEILVIENGPPAWPAGSRGQLRRAYGTLQERVKIIPAAAVATVPPKVGGWFSQQVLKLMIAKRVRSRRYLLIDAKHHFIFPLTAAHLEANGKPRSFVYGYLNHPLRRYLEPILHYFNLSDDHLQRFLPTTPPFVLDTQFVRDMMAAIAQRESRSFEDVFCTSPTRFTEFFLLGAYILSTKRQFEDYYDLSGGGCSVIWKEVAADDTVVDREIARSEQRASPCFAVHRAALPLLSNSSKHRLAAFWLRRGLFATEAEGLRYLADPNGHGVAC